MEDGRHHIADTHADHEGKSLCGVSVTGTWYFHSIDHAFNSMRSGSYNIPCKRCAKIVASRFAKMD